MTTLRLARPIGPVLARLAVIALALAALVPGQPIRAAAAPSRARHARLLRGPAGPAVNSPPVANDDSLAAFTDEDFQRLYVLDNDTDPNFDTLTITDVGFAAHGDAAPDFYAVDYKPFPGFSGTDSFNYTISDGHGLTDTATVTVHVGATGTASNRFAIYAGPYDSSRWTVNPHGGTTGPTSSGACNGALGLGVEDVLLQNPNARYNAFDNGLTLWVNGQQVTPTFPMYVTHHSLDTGPLLLGGVNVIVYYDGLRGTDTLRTRVVFANTSGSTKNITATLATNLGSDGQTVIVGSSTGDLAFTTADRWLVTSDDATNPGLIVSTHVLFGPGSPPATPSFVANTSFVCGEEPIGDTHGVRARFNLSIGSGAVKQLLFFNQAHSTNTAALADAVDFNHTPLGYLDGLSNIDLSQVVNWKIGPISRLFLPLVQR